MYKITTSLKKIHSIKKRVKIIQGSSSSGKTISILIILIDKCVANPLLEVSVVSESIPHLKKGAIKDFLKIMKATGRFIEKNYNKSDRKYTFTNGSYIEFFSPEAVLGARRDILFVNECINISFTDYHQLSVRTNKEIFLDYNPAHEFWANTEVEKDNDSEKIILTYNDNEGCPENIITELHKARDKAHESEYWRNWWQVYGLGQLGTIEGVVFEKFIPCAEFPKDCKWVVYGMDFGYTNDPTTLIKVGLRGGELYFEQMIYQTGMTNGDIARRLKELGIGKAEIVADSAEPKSIKDLQNMGFNVRGAVKGKDSIINGIDLIKRYKVNMVTDSLETIREWRTYSYKFDKALNKYYNEPEDMNNHSIDAIRYALSYKLATHASSPMINVLRRR